MSAAYTPGPWTLHRLGAVVGGKFRQYANGTAQDQIAMVCHTRDDPEQRDANARLIAAAPDLLLALGILTDTIAFQFAGVVEQRLARAAIAKATGVTP